jgi:hypothetical protein
MAAKKQPERVNTTSATVATSGRPLGVKTAVDDSGCVTSNETLKNSTPSVTAAGLPSEKAGTKKVGIFGSKGSGIAGWFRGTGKSSNKLTDKV